MTNIHYLGPVGTFSEIAARRAARELLPDGTLTPCPSVRDVAQRIRAAAEQGEKSLGIVPYYNLLEGLVQESLDVIQEYHCEVIRLVRIAIVFCAGAKHVSDQKTNTTSKVASHPKALAQCAAFIAAHYPQATQMPMPSTAEAAAYAARTVDTVAIASEEALQSQGLTLIARDVGDKRFGRGNFTDFFCIQAQGDGSRPSQTGANRSLVAITPDDDRSGLLVSILSLFAQGGINLAKIHSRPAVMDLDDRSEPQTFYIEAERGPEDADLQKCVGELRALFQRDPRQVRLLGGFIEPV